MALKFNHRQDIKIAQKFKIQSHNLNIHFTEALLVQWLSLVPMLEGMGSNTSNANSLANIGVDKTIVIKYLLGKVKSYRKLFCRRRLRVENVLKDVEKAQHLWVGTRQLP